MDIPQCIMQCVVCDVLGECSCKQGAIYKGTNVFFQIMVSFLSYISNACHSLSGVAERLQHTRERFCAQIRLFLRGFKKSCDTKFGFGYVRWSHRGE